MESNHSGLSPSSLQNISVNANHQILADHPDVAVKIDVHIYIYKLYKFGKYINMSMCVRMEWKKTDFAVGDI